MYRIIRLFGWLNSQCRESTMRWITAERLLSQNPSWKRWYVWRLSRLKVCVSIGPSLRESDSDHTTAGLCWCFWLNGGVTTWRDYNSKRGFERQIPCRRLGAELGTVRVKVVFNHDPLRFCPTFDDLYLERPSIWLIVVWREERRKKNWSWKQESETWKSGETRTLRTEKLKTKKKGKKWELGLESGP